MPDIRLTRTEEQGRLPAACMCCGAPATAYVEQSFPVRPPAPQHPSRSAIVTAIQVLQSVAQTPRVRIRTSFCAAHRNYWRWRLALQFGGLAGVFAVLVAGLVVVLLLLFVAKIDRPWVGCFAIVPLATYLAVWITTAALVARRTIRVRTAEDGSDALLLMNVDARYVEAVERQRTGDAAAAPPVAVFAGPPTAILLGPPAERVPAAVAEGSPPDDRRRTRGTTSAPLAVISAILTAILICCVLVMCVVRVGRLVDWVTRDRAEQQNHAQKDAPEGGKAGANGEPDHDPAPGWAVVGAPPHPALPAVLQGKASVDLIPLMQRRKDIVSGRWAVVGDELHCPEGNFVPRVQFPYEPPVEYDFVVTFWQPGLRNGISLTMPNPNGGSFYWYLAGSGGQTYGFSSNPNKGGQIPGLIQAKQTHTTVAQVRRASVRGLVDGKELLTVATDFRDLTSDDWHRIHNPKYLSVACDDPTVFQYIRVVEVSGPGRRAR
jgi:hypothetical protein